MTTEKRKAQNREAQRRRRATDEGRGYMRAYMVEYRKAHGDEINARRREQRSETS